MSIYHEKSLGKRLAFVTRVRIPLGSQWLMLVITGVVFVLVATFVDLTPVVDQIFSFQRMIRESSRPKRSSNRERTGRARFSDSYRGSALRRRNAPTQSGARFPLLQSHGGCLVWSNDGGAVPINPAVSRNALHMRVPVDIISAPATNVCTGIAIDSMIHLMFGVRRAQRDGKKGWDAWVFAREEQWHGIVYSDVIIAAGFAIFVLSDFPPTQRFGLVVLAGCIIDIVANLFVLPLLGGAPLKKRV
jgi:hypothetical protein